MLAGLGYGLAQVGAGLSGGLVRGQAYQDQKEREKRLFQMQEAQLGANLARMQETERHNKATEQTTAEANQNIKDYRTAMTGWKEAEQRSREEEAERKAFADKGKAHQEAMDLNIRIFSQTKNGKSAQEAAQNYLKALYPKEQFELPLLEMSPDGKFVTEDYGDKVVKIPTNLPPDAVKAVQERALAASQQGIILTPEQLAKMMPGAVVVSKSMSEYQKKSLTQKVAEGYREDKKVELKEKELGLKERKADQEKIDTEDKALARLTAIAEKRTRMAESLAKLKSSGVSEEMYKVFPKLLDFGFLLGQKLSPEEISKVEKVHAEQLKTLAEEEARLRAKHLKGGTAPAPAPKAEEKRRPEVSAVATEMKTKKQKAGQYKVEGYLGYWDGKEFKYTE